jgi:signal transduction histidine kinase
MSSQPSADSAIASKSLLDSKLKVPATPSQYRAAGSLGRRMLGVATLWIVVLLSLGGYALDRVLTNAITRNFDEGLEYVLTAMAASAEIDDFGEVRLIRPLGDQRFLEPYSGLYWQISGPGVEPFRSRSLWDRAIKQQAEHIDEKVHVYDSDEFRKGTEQDEVIRIAERDFDLPGSKITWRFQVAQDRSELNAQIATIRWTLGWSFLVLAFGLIAMAALQTIYGLWPLRSLRSAISEMRAGRQQRLETGELPSEVAPLVNELNGLLEHNERQAEEARTHAGNLAHALKTPLTVIMNAATAHAIDLDDTVIREATTMRRQVDHHLARARAVGRRGHAHSRAEVWPSLDSVERAVARLHDNVRMDMDGEKTLAAHVERQDLDEMLGNLIENAAKYGGGSVFVTVSRADDMVDIAIEDDGPGISPENREKLFNRGARLDSNKPGTGLGLAIVRDVAEIYGGSVVLEESEDMGGLLARLRLPLAE